MTAFPPLAELSSEPFSGDEVVHGIVADPAHGDGPGRVRVEVDGHIDVPAFYGAAPEGSCDDPVIFLRGDAVELRDGVLAANEFYRATSPHDVQALCEQYSAVDAALTRLKRHFGWRSINLVGQSGGGHLVAALIARRDDVDCAVIASGNTAVARRNCENGWATDITGHADFLDPIDHVADVARHPPNTLIVPTDPAGCAGLGLGADRLCRAALRAAGVTVDHRFLPAAGKLRHDLQAAGVLAAFAHLQTRNPA